MVKFNKINWFVYQHVQTLWHFVTAQIHLKYSPKVIFPFSSASTALKRCVTLICDTPMAVFRI